MISLKLIENLRKIINQDKNQEMTKKKKMSMEAKFRSIIYLNFLLKKLGHKQAGFQNKALN